MSDHSLTSPLADPGEASAEEGHVVLDGPDGVAITLTAEAAVITGERLIEAGKRALEQQEPKAD
jgi:hypothetical protein